MQKKKTISRKLKSESFKITRDGGETRSFGEMQPQDVLQGASGRKHERAESSPTYTIKGDRNVTITRIPLRQKHYDRTYHEWEAR